MPANAVLALTRAAKPPPVSLICGDETQLIEEARTAIRRHFDADDRHSVDLAQLRPQDATLGLSKGLFGGGAELFQLSSAAKPTTEGLAYIDAMIERLQPPDCMTLIILEWDYKHKKAVWFKKLAERMQVFSCERLSPAAARQWVDHWAAEQNVALDEEAARFLCLQTEGNLFAAKQAIAKLALAGGENGEDAGGGSKCDAAAVRRVLADGARYDILDLSDAIYAGEPARALKVFASLRAAGVADALIQWSVFSVINNVAAAKSGGRVLAWGKQLLAVQQLAGNVNDNMLRRLTAQAAYADRVTKGVATGDAGAILSGIIARLAAWQRGVKMTLPHYQPWQ